MADAPKLHVVRCHMSGVWVVAELVGPDPMLPGFIVLRGRRAWSWTGATDCSAMAVRGPTGGIFTPHTEVSVQLTDIVESQPMHPAAIEAVNAIPDHEPVEDEAPEDG